jgi:hypothetical protein
LSAISNQVRVAPSRSAILSRVIPERWLHLIAETQVTLSDRRSFISYNGGVWIWLSSPIQVSVVLSTWCVTRPDSQTSSRWSRPARLLLVEEPDGIGLEPQPVTGVFQQPQCRDHRPDDGT